VTEAQQGGIFNEENVQRIFSFLFSFVFVPVSCPVPHMHAHGVLLISISTNNVPVTLCAGERKRFACTDLHHHRDFYCSISQQGMPHPPFQPRFFADVYANFALRSSGDRLPAHPGLLPFCGLHHQPTAPGTFFLSVCTHLLPPHSSKSGA
jgi:hypothetical protein